MTTDEYVPSEAHFRDYYVGGRSEYDPEYTDDMAARRDWGTFLARVRRDAAREALVELRRTELALIPPDADEDDPVRTRQQALAWRIEMRLLGNHPEEAP